jgi:hypothetical protein
MMMDAPEHLHTTATDDERVEWIETTIEAVRTLAASHGWTVGGEEKSARSFSWYITLDRGDDSIIVRVTDHAPGMAGQNADHELNATSRYLAMAWRDLVEALRL